MLAATQVNVATGRQMKPSDFFPPTRKRPIQLSERQLKQLAEKRKRDKKVK